MTASDFSDGARAQTVVLPAEESLRARILVANIACLARWGMAKTTLDDVAREAGCGRATIYRTFPGGKDELMRATGEYEEARFFGQLADRFEAASSLEDLLTIGISEAAGFLQGHEALQYLMAHEPEVVLSQIAFDRCGPVLYRATALSGPYLARFVPLERVSEVAEFAVRLVLSYALGPSDTVDLSKPDHARRIVTRYLLPAVTTPGSTPPVASTYNTRETTAAAVAH